MHFAFLHFAKRLWKSDVGTFWLFSTMSIHKLQQFSFSKLFFGQKIIFDWCYFLLYLLYSIFYSSVTYLVNKSFFLLILGPQKTCFMTAYIFFSNMYSVDRQWRLGRYILVMSPSRAGSSHSSIWRIFSLARLVTFFHSAWNRKLAKNEPKFWFRFLIIILINRFENY